MPAANCKLCKRMFNKVYSPYCPECYEVHSENLSEIYRFIQENETMTLEEIALHSDISVQELERVLFSGELGTASSKVIYHCQRCDIAISPLNRRGRFCLRCTSTIEKEAKIDAESKRQRAMKKTKQDVILFPAEEPAETTKKYRYTAVAKPEPPPEEDTQKYGFTRNN